MTPSMRRRLKQVVMKKEVNLVRTYPLLLLLFEVKFLPSTLRRVWLTLTTLHPRTLLKASRFQTGRPRCSENLTATSTGRLSKLSTGPLASPSCSLSCFNLTSMMRRVISEFAKQGMLWMGEGRLSTRTTLKLTLLTCRRSLFDFCVG